MGDAQGWQTPWSRVVVAHGGVNDNNDDADSDHPWARPPPAPATTRAWYAATGDARPATLLPATASRVCGQEPRPSLIEIGGAPAQYALGAEEEKAGGGVAVTVPAAELRAQRNPARLCKAAGCDNYIVHKGLCCRHGGGKRCSVDGCHASAKQRGLCWRHGGSSECKVDGCPNKAKAKGVCWSHGGGTPCALAACPKIAVSNGLCWAHGGGKRCIHDGCQRPAFERTHGFCDKHFRELQHVDYYEV